jgi:hypothetical protein
MLTLERYLDQQRRLPASGRLVLAQYDEHRVVVYQAFRGEIADDAVRQQRLVGSFALDRMSWIKTSFLWMMHRSAWGTAKDQERVLAISLRRSCFDSILNEAVPTKYERGVYPSRSAWQAALRPAEVYVQWDPDRDPLGGALQRRVIQLGLRGEVLRRYATEWIGGVEDITTLVATLREQRAHIDTYDLCTPSEHVYHTPSSMDRG